VLLSITTVEFEKVVPTVAPLLNTMLPPVVKGTMVEL
jgi:hypothetical protein